MKEEVYKKIDLVFKKDKDLLGLIRDYYKLSIAFRFFCLFGALLLLFGLLSMYILESDQDLSISLFYVGVILLVVGLNFFLIALLIFICGKNKGRKLKLIKMQFSDNKMDDIYNLVFINNFKNEELTDLKINFNINEKTLVVKNSLDFIYKDTEISFIIDEPIKVKTRDLYTDLSSEIIVWLLIWIWKPRYECYDRIIVKTKRFDNTFNGLEVKKAKKFDKNFQTESIEFNKKYDINLKTDDLRAPLFLTPKLIDKLVNTSDPDFDVLGYKDNLYYVRSRITKGYALEQIGVINYEKVKSYRIFRREMYKKIMQDFEYLNNSLSIISAII
ncbi:hypothetical protein SLITO_v1c10520 [Spiroplasma litorale]|uniref:DUF3137 domain-containing protein n=1 Tax=Spiroplasma litorale TaxID=216942 RepID=A0A0K1W3A5_9MOLU|nr:hypothetical protein [Spiroplasma litorale]AKX34663.1 hypothetical protein SLITO_v1c10520 [Spiroplasma litorale]